jgi:hypothetical protein
VVEDARQVTPSDIGRRLQSMSVAERNEYLKSLPLDVRDEILQEFGWPDPEIDAAQGVDEQGLDRMLEELRRRLTED